VLRARASAAPRSTPSQLRGQPLLLHVVAFSVELPNRGNRGALAFFLLPHKCIIVLGVVMLLLVFLLEAAAW
jgi:hypothetical protein